MKHAQSAALARGTRNRLDGKLRRRPTPLLLAAANVIMSAPRSMKHFTPHSSGVRRCNDALNVTALCLGATALGLLMWWTGSGLSPDSVTYLDVAENLLAGRGLVHRWAYWDPVYQTCELPTASTMWPPGYSLAIAAVSSFGVTTYSAARIISLLSFALLPLPLYALLRFFLRSKLSVACTAFCMMLLPTAQHAQGIGSEGPFLLAAALCVTFAVLAVRNSNAASSIRYWLLASAAAGAAFQFRYVGVACAGTVALLAIWCTRPCTTRTRWLALAAAIAPSGLLIGAVLVRNLATSGTPLQPWPGAAVFGPTLIHSLRAAAGALIGSTEFLGNGVWLLLRPVQVLLLIALVGLATANAARCVALRAWLPAAPTRIASAVIGVFLLVYLAVVLGACAQNGMNVESRYLTVVCPLAFILMLGWALRAVRLAGPRLRPAWSTRAAGATFVLLWVCQGALITRLYLTSPHESYVAQTRHSPTIDWVRSHLSAEEPILSNRGCEIAYWSGNPVLRVPQLPHSAGHVTTWEAIDHIADKFRARYLVHWRGYSDPAKYNSDEFEFLHSLDEPACCPERRPLRFADSVIYQVGSQHMLTRRLPASLAPPRPCSLMKPLTVADMIGIAPPDLRSFVGPLVPRAALRAQGAVGIHRREGNSIRDTYVGLPRVSHTGRNVHSRVDGRASGNKMEIAAGRIHEVLAGFNLTDDQVVGGNPPAGGLACGGAEDGVGNGMRGNPVYGLLNVVDHVADDVEPAMICRRGTIRINAAWPVVNAVEKYRNRSLLTFVIDANG